jgi:hypothetical protein
MGSHGNGRGHQCSACPRPADLMTPNHGEPMTAILAIQCVTFLALGGLSPRRR